MRFDEHAAALTGRGEDTQVGSCVFQNLLIVPAPLTVSRTVLAASSVECGLAGSGCARSMLTGTSVLMFVGRVLVVLRRLCM